MRLEQTTGIRIAGGLSHDFALGDLVVASEIATEKGRFPTDLAWSNRIREAVPHARSAVIVGVDAGIKSRSRNRSRKRNSGSLNKADTALALLLP